MEKRTYVMEDASRITRGNLSLELQKLYSENEIYEILDLKFLADDDVFLTEQMCEKRGITITEDNLKKIFDAEEIYLRQISVM